MNTTSIEATRAEIEQEIAGRTLWDELTRNAERHPAAPAMSWKAGDAWKTMTWREYRDQVEEVAVGLAELGVAKGDFVAIMAANRPEHIIADQGALRAGAVPTTFYATLTPDQIRYVAGNCDAKVAVLENRDYMKRWQEIRSGLPNLEFILLLEDAGDFGDLEGVRSWESVVEAGRAKLAADRSAAAAMPQAEPGDPATVVYTSGTTGPPKGVTITHHNVLFQCASLDRLTRLPDGITGVSYLPLAHIAERELSIYLAQRKRKHVYFCPDQRQALEYLLEARPTLFFGVPRVWEKVRTAITAKIDAEPNERKRKLAHAAIETGRQMVALQGRSPSVLLKAKHALLDRLVLSKIRKGIGLDQCVFQSSAAAPLSVDVAEFFAGIGLPLYEVYGMTENTGAATGNPPDKLKIGTVGPGIPGVEVKLAEDGEVLIRGPINTPGYHKQPEATAELIDEEGWLHTGDIGQIDADGYLKILDRKKELIITSGGKNLSPANIEALLKQHPLIGQALAFGNDRPFVVALIVLDGEVAPGWAAQRSIGGSDVEALSQHPKVLAEVELAVARTNEGLARVEQVKKFAVLPTEWTAESEELTPTLKLKRRVIHDKYGAKIEELYAG
ncbi:MAG: AMP-binding protein [Nitriliruptorales bacterium]|nr:AMP-binding protein [Nitriliruptorales bacterium]